LLNVNESRVQQLARVLSLLDVSFYKKLEESDPQYKAIRNLCNICDPYGVPLLVSLNALVSYRLSCKGEVYWQEFSNFIQNYCKSASLTEFNDYITAVIDFLNVSQCNISLRKTKVKRLMKLRDISKDTMSVFKMFTRDPEEFRIWLSEHLNTELDSKTIVFAVKMYYYGCRACLNVDMTLPFTIPIPVDRRVALISYTSGLVSCYSDNPIDAIMRRQKVIRKVWSKIAYLCNTPPLHLDSLLWIVGGHIRRGKPIARDRIVNELVKCVSEEYKDKIALVVGELTVQSL